MKKLKLSPKFVRELIELPESNMGFQMVNIILKNGDVLFDRVILDCEYLKLNVSETISVKDIKEIEIDIDMVR